MAEWLAVFDVPWARMLMVGIVAGGAWWLCLKLIVSMFAPEGRDE